MAKIRREALQGSDGNCLYGNLGALCPCVNSLVLK